MSYNFLPKSLKKFIKARLKRMVFPSPVAFMKYLPIKYNEDWFLIPNAPDSINDTNKDTRNQGLAMPPKELWIGGPTKEFYLYWGEKDVGKMIEILDASNFSLQTGYRILDFGCREGRMIRHLKHYSETCEIWGVDASAAHIYWCKRNLDPPFHFATTTTIPHLPFEDSYFDFIYAGSVFTHIDDLAESWLLEIRRVLSPKGRAYLTIHDKHTISLVDKCYEEYSSKPEANESQELLSTRLFSSNLHAEDVYKKNKDSNFGMFVHGRDICSQVFYDIDYFRKTLAPMFDIVSITEEAYSEYQTAVLCKKK
ncbi:MAG: methyltransferase domain-containing protein [Methyloprofundus sp.]|nr:methyltransferase domain-containing protein [Methyloprofundus sp.]